jgi:hypothetical protein
MILMKYNWLTSFLKLPRGVPSHDTFNRVLCMIDAEQLQQSFVNWVNDIRNSIKIPDINEESLEDKDVISIDGKTVCNSMDKVAGNGAENLNTIRKIALNTIKRDNTVQTSFKNKRKMCAWNDNFALNILKNMKA